MPEPFTLQPQCPKCGRSGINIKPEWVEERDCLLLTCSCGYSWTSQTKDAQPR